MRPLAIFFAVLVLLPFHVAIAQDANQRVVLEQKTEKPKPGETLTTTFVRAYFPSVPPGSTLATDEMWYKTKPVRSLFTYRYYFAGVSGGSLHIYRLHGKDTAIVEKDLILLPLSGDGATLTVRTLGGGQMQLQLKKATDGTLAVTGRLLK